MSKRKTPQIPKKKEVPLVRSSAAEYLTFVAATGGGGVEAVYADENIWLTQKMMGVLYDVNVRTVNEHLKKIFADSELQEDSVIRKFRITASDGKNYNTLHYKLPAIIAVGYKVNSERAVQFRKWATGIIEQFTIKAYVMDDERIKAGGSILTEEYFEEQLQRIREIRLSERKFHQKITDIYVTAIDYDVTAQATKRFFATVQNKLHWAIHGQTAAEVIYQRADAGKDNMGVDHLEGCAQRQDPEIRCGGGQELPHRDRNGATLPLGQRLFGRGRGHGTAQDPHDHAGLGNPPESLYRSYRPGSVARRWQGDGGNRQGPR